MKKSLAFTITLCLCASAFGQGTIHFANTASSLVTINGGPAIDYHVSLYWGVVGSTEAQVVQIGASLGNLNPALPGRFSSGVSYVTGNGTAPGANGIFEVRGWTGNFTTWEAAYADALAGGGELFANSGLFLNATGGDTAGGTQPPSTPANLTGFRGFDINCGPCPEPSTLPLGGLGAVGLLLFRRRK